MVNLMVRVIMGIGVLAASFMAGRQTTVTTPNRSELAVPAAAVSTVSTLSHSSPTTSAAVIARTSTDKQVRPIPLAEQIRLADTVAQTAVGGGQVISVTPGQFNQIPVWQVRIQQLTQQWNVLVAQSGHNVIAKNLAQ